jgi:carbonic anhydrase/acetyltransferase-like protein (isoleucine patch superfamily)
VLVEHEGRAPHVDSSAWVAPTAVLCGDVRVGAGAEVRINGVVHVNSKLPDGGVVPIGWVAVGDPAQVLAPERHDDIWAIQRELDFPGTVLGVERGAPAADATARYAELFGRHREDRILG